ncbi:MAG: hydroxymethylbilane synthase [Thermoleophilia bacterium]|nr:hydroxymethylbilane synthase [Thermoleophilia bacterium]
MSRLIRIGTRGSSLAIWQADHVRAALQEADSSLRFETVVISTRGDLLPHRALPSMGGKGVFTEELEQALRDGSVDLAVHSLKDLPTVLPSDLALGAVTARADSSDVLVSRGGFTLASLPCYAKVGSSSTRRKAQLLVARPDLAILDLRGNIDTRLDKARHDEGPYDAIVVAYAALERMEELGAISEVLSEEIMLPAPGQGAIAVECRAESEWRDLAGAVGHAASEVETRAERAFLEALGGGCAAPVAARARLGVDGVLRLRGRVIATDGRTQIGVYQQVAVGTGTHAQAGAETLGRSLASEALGKGAAALLRQPATREAEGES